MNGASVKRIPFEDVKPMSAPKLCKRCKHCIPDRSYWWFCLFLPLAPLFAWWASNNQWKFSRCRRTQKPLYLSDGHRFTGERYNEEFAYRYCAREREKGYAEENPCGPEAKYFEARS